MNYYMAGEDVLEPNLCQDVECDPEEIRALFDDESDEDKDEGPTRLPYSRPDFIMKSSCSS